MKNVALPEIDFNKFRILLQNEFERKKEVNPSYSLRSYAKQLDIHASCLSVILRGKRPLTKKLVDRFIEKLSLGEADLKYIQSDEGYHYENLSLDILALTADWKHDAVLELLKWDDVVHEDSWIAKTLGLSITETQIIIERLHRLELIKVENNKYILTHDNTEFQIENLTNAALKKYQKLSIERSAKALDETDISKRYHGTMVMSINESLISEAKQALRDFRLKFCQDLQSQGNFNQVYQLNLGFYPLTNNGEEK